MAIVGTLPYTLANGATADASQVMANYNYIVSQVNANAAPTTAYSGGSNVGLVPTGGTGSTYLKGDGTWATPAGSGNVSTSGSPAQHQLALFSSGTEITGITVPVSGTILQGVATADPTFTATPTLGVQQTTRGTLTLANTAAGAYATTLQSSNSATAAATLTLPPAPPAVDDYVLSAKTTGVMAWVAQSGGGGTPGGSNTQVQFNNSSAFGGSANLTWVSPALTIGAQQTTRGTLTLANTAAGAYATTLQSSNSATAAVTLTLPPAPPAVDDYVLSAKTTGVMAWVAQSGGGGGMVYPGAGLPISTGSAWDTSITLGTGVATALAANVTGSGGIVGLAYVTDTRASGGTAGNITLALADAGKQLYHPAADTASRVNYPTSSDRCIRRDGNNSVLH